ncbi:parallel beta helix pectate lyase-like protein [Serratia fonticola]|uniref:Parallel beta helix pectate lyase-like protein n=1 Tax=Serratia fonticola TaxID=47917 RepID=A0A559T8Y8_SERFO|nr:right-handed parallel beta-helix repeat-containing protein [Serratia fonticola]TQI81424.1 parallel beta helix pectate lyase-like protein [Serratia fonticola]TQI96552.1 parallel beta helix pectate lyase-like protein [Serratia fonticola]TVZ71049.1 parallel beta helix pectate lyase-like protein [Serratia fonticola]
MKIVPLSLFCAVASFSVYCSAAPLPAANELVWQTVVFGQSTDVNFATNVVPGKVGTNQVTMANGQPLPKGPLTTPFHIESRGGKIGNSHDGLTFYYTRLPASANMVLEADITVDQFGPENEALPAGQEGAGLLIRDILGKPRLEKTQPGYEEFPAAANMVMNAIMTQDKKDHHRVKMTMISRNGVLNSWGNAGIEIKREGYQPQIDLRKTPSFRLRLARTEQGFTAAYAPLGSDNWVSHTTGDPQRITKLDPEGYYVGFFASRNARITVERASLTLSESHQPVTENFVAKARPVQIEVGSSTLSATDEYVFQLRSNKSGSLTLSKDGVVLAADRAVQAGEMLALNVPLTQPDTRLDYHFTTPDGKTLSNNLSVRKGHYADARNLYVSPQGKVENDGSREHPLDFATAAQALTPGGTLWLAPGDYPFSVLPATASGTAADAKKLRPLGDNVVFHGLNLDASYWDIQGITITEKSFSIMGSHNRINRVVAHHADDTGIVVTSLAETDRPLWASHNLISHAESYANKDPGMINADGFAVKMRVGEGNRLVACFAHDNADDGFDLFNKIEDGPNGRVIIENSIALRNVNNGFKLGGEGLPVAHEISGSIAMENGMDGFTDNFNPGALKVTNNTAIDNQRFNYIFRPGPYSKEEKQGIFNGNISLRTKPGKYADAVVGQIADNNDFILALEQ